MNEVTPDLIAQIATQMFQESAQVPTSEGAVPGIDSIPGVSSIPLSPMPVAGSVPGIESIPQRPTFSPGASFPSPTLDHVPAAPVSPLSPAIVKGLPTGGAQAFFPSGQSWPAGIPDSADYSFPAAVNPGASHSVADVSYDGLQRFVQRVRNPSQTSEPGFCPGSPGVNFLQQLLGKKDIPAPVLSGGSRPLDVASIRRDFPALNQKVHGKPLVWFDNAATTQKPQSVIDAISYYYAHDNSNIHRAAHTLAARSTDAFEGVRDKVKTFLGAATSKEIIFVRGTTEGINLISQTYGRKFLRPGDEIVLSTLEHHANIVPWQMVAKETGAIIRVIPVTDQGEIMLEEYQQLLGPKTKLVALTQASNSLGTILPVTEMTQMAKRYGARVLIDGAQSVSHIPVNVQEMGCDFFVFSGHKIFGPTGIGVVYAKQELQEIMPPWQGGGNMIKNVTFEETTFSDPPNKFEAGTPNIADTVGLGAALDYVQRLGLTNIGKYEHFLLEYATERLLPINGLRLLGQAREKVSVISFVLRGRKTEEIGKLLDAQGIAVRAGHHCSQPSLRRYGVESTVRPSLAFYNTTDEIDHLVESVKRINSGSVHYPVGGQQIPSVYGTGT